MSDDRTYDSEGVELVAQAVDVLGPIAILPNRDAMHRWMGPPGCCDLCWGRGYYPDHENEPLERYCDCPCGKERMRVDGA